MTTTPPLVITISRLLCSGGAYLGQQLARRLDYRYVDREILEQASAKLGTEEESLLGREERRSGFWEKLLWTFSVSTPEVGYVPPPLRVVYDKELLETEAGIIREIATRSNAVIMGRGGAHILQGRPNLVRVFVHAPGEFRLQRVMELYGMTADGARETMEESDRERAKFVRSTFGVYFGDARLYDLCIDTAATGFTLAEEMVIQLVEECRRRYPPGA
jgi:CMP/dCMP kinase